MSLHERITKDLFLALKNHQAFKVRVLRMLQASIIGRQKEKRYRISKENPMLAENEFDKTSLLSDDEIIDLILSDIKKRREAALEFEKGGRRDLAEGERKEMEILQKYLPEQLSDEEIRELAIEAIKKIGVKELKDMGKVMADLMPRIRGKAEGGRVSGIVKELLTLSGL